MKIFTCSQTIPLRDFTDCVYPQGSFCFSRLLRDRDIKVNGVRVSNNVPLKPGDSVSYYTTEREEKAASHKVAYSDENILAADKFSGVTSEGLCAELNAYGAYFAVHRLDRNTAGLIIYARNADSESRLLRAFREGGIKKSYLAVCRDNFKNDGGVLRAYLLKDEKNSLVKVLDKKVPFSREIVTEYSVLQRADGLCLARVILHTGRTHQIRAHLAHVGCPVLGDEKYGDGALNKRYGARRQRLLSKTVEFSGLSGNLAYLNGFSVESSMSLSLEDCRPVK